MLIICCIILNVFIQASYAMGTAPPAPTTPEVISIPTASEEALAKEQIDNLRNNAMSSETIQEAFNKAIGDIYSGKKYLYEFNEVAQKELLRIAGDKKENWKFRIAAMSGMGSDRPPEAFDLERKIYEDKSERAELRQVAFLELMSTKRPEKKNRLVSILINALKDNDWVIVARAANKLGEIKDPIAVEPLIESVRRTRNNLDELLQNGWKEYEKGTQPEEHALSNSIRALGEIGDKRAVAILIKVLKDQYVPNNTIIEDGTIGWAIIALRKINDKSAIEPIKEVLKTTQNYRIAEVARDALRKMEKNNKINEKGKNL